MRSLGAIGSSGLIWLLSQFSASPCWAQASEAQCQLYADVAISQVQLASGCPGMSGGGRWSTNWDDHFNFCRSISTSESRNHEYSARQTALIFCTGHFPRVAMRDCIDYGIRALSQADLAFYKDCGFAGARWVRDWMVHRDFCLNGHFSVDITGAPSAEDEQRRIALAACTNGTHRQDQQDIIAVHNEERARHCAGFSGQGTMLGWSLELAAAAQQWAGACTRDPSDPTRFAHSPDASRPGQGENLAWGPGLSGQAAATLWYNEVNSYHFDAPVWSPQVGHFTQIVWRTTTQMGCDSATCGDQTLWVCRYTPAGNINVQVPPATPAQAQQSLIDNVPRLCMP